MRKLRRADPALIFFAMGAFACLVVSIPATSAAMDIFHGSTWGWVATSVFELGAVGLELMSLAIPQWRGRLLLSMLSMLVITTAFNYATGIDQYVTAKLSPGTTYDQIRAYHYGWLLTIAAAALFPGMLGGFLLGLTARARMLRARLHTPMSVVAFWLSIYGQSLGSARTDAEQRAILAERALNDVERQCEQLRRSDEQMREHYEQLLSSRPAPMTVEVIEVARYRLTHEQLAQLAGASVSTIRRKLPHIATIIDQGDKEVA